MIEKTILTIFALGLFSGITHAEEITLWFPPESRTKEVATITQLLIQNSELDIQPRVAKSYPQILDAFQKDTPQLVFGGSFVQAILKKRQLGTPIVQFINGREFYSGVLIFPQGGDPKKILENSPEAIAFATGSTSGEASAKAATKGKAGIACFSHSQACEAVIDGKAKAAFVKNWWWERKMDNYPKLHMWRHPDISKKKNPDYVLSASSAVDAKAMAHVAKAAIAGGTQIPLTDISPFQPRNLDFTLELMSEGKIDPKTYKW